MVASQEFSSRTRPFRIGLTGSIGTGKTTTARMFAEAGLAVFDVDAAVHTLYAGTAAAAIERAFPGTLIDGAIDRDRLGAAVVGDDGKMARLEAIVHPLVHDARRAFIDEAAARGDEMVVIDIPLLFETGAEAQFDAIVVVTASAAVQQARVMARPGMTARKFAYLQRRQVADRIKRERADFIVDTDQGMASARAQVEAIIRSLRARI